MSPYLDCLRAAAFSGYLLREQQSSDQRELECKGQCPISHGSSAPASGEVTHLYCSNKTWRVVLDIEITFIYLFIYLFTPVSLS
jgi:hypothetical protein